MLLFAFFMSCVGFAINLGILFVHLYEYIIGTAHIMNVVFSLLCAIVGYLVSEAIIKIYFQEKEEEPCDVQLDLPEQEEEVVIKRNKLENGEEKKFKGRPRKEELPEFLMNDVDKKKAHRRKLARIRYANASIETRRKLSKHRYKNKVAIK